MAIGTELQVTIRLDNAPAVHGYSVVVSYDPAQLTMAGRQGDVSGRKHGILRER